MALRLLEAFVVLTTSLINGNFGSKSVLSSVILYQGAPVTILRIFDCVLGIKAIFNWLVQR